MLIADGNVMLNRTMRRSLITGEWVWVPTRAEVMNTFMSPLTENQAACKAALDVIYPPVPLFRDEGHAPGQIVARENAWETRHRHNREVFGRD